MVRGQNNPQRAILTVAGKLQNYEQMVTSRIPLEDTVHGGFEELVNNRDSHVKILISPKLVKAGSV